MAASRGTVDRGIERRVVHLSGRAALTIVGTIVVLIVARRMFVAAHRPLSWAAATVVAAIVLDPVVDRLAVHIRRVPAVLVTFLAIGAVVLGTAYVVFDEVDEAVDRMERAAPEAAGAIEARGDRVGQVASDFDLTGRASSFAEALGARVSGGGDVLRDRAGAAPVYLVCAVLTVFLMTYGPRMARGALDQVPDEGHRERIAEVVGPAVARARRGLLLVAGTGGLVGLATSGLAAALGLPAPAAVGLGAGVMALLPHVGILIGSVPLMLLALGFRSATSAVLLLAVALVAQGLDSVLVRPAIARRSVDMGLLVPWVVALVGYAVYGIGGALYGLAFAVAGLAVLDRLAELDDA